MKKVFFAIAFLFAVTMNGFSQGDTVYIDLSDSNYYTDINGWALDSVIIPITGYWGVSQICSELRYTDTTLIIYGIAVSHYGPNLLRPELDISTTTYTGDEQTWLYKPCPDGTMRPLDHGSYNVLDPTPYYLPPYPVSIPGSGMDTIAMPLYETYFDDVAVVTDSFYIGASSSYVVRTTLYSHEYVSQPASRRFIIDPAAPVESRPHSRIICSQDQGVSWRYSPIDKYSSMICYPILTPDPNRDTVANPYHYPWDTAGTDTTHVDTTHNGIAAQLLEKYINVYPTVADGGAVTVLSSFHLEGVEVYDAAGRMLSRQPASGVATTVDVSQLPAGSYVLRVNTVSGSTTKKFLKR